MGNPIHVRAPASTANLGPAFDSAGVALDLWNELTVEEGEGISIEGEGAEELARDDSHLGLQAFRLLAPTDGWRFSFTNRIPLARGLGSSAATIAAGLVAGALCAGREPRSEQLLELAFPLEGHPDNIAPALLGGVCLSWLDDGGSPWAARIASDVPLRPILVVPEERSSTTEARAALPETVPHADAAYTAGRAAMLGAALAAGSPELMRRALSDRLHEPYRGGHYELYTTLRGDLPAGTAGLTISGAGPAVVVWADEAIVDAVAVQTAERAPAARVLTPAVAASGAASIP